MNCVCSNLRNKKVLLESQESSLYLNKEKIDLECVFFQNCSGTYEFFEVVLQLKSPWNKKNVIFLNSSWLKKASKSLEDNELIDNLNDLGSSILKEYNPIELEVGKSFQGRVEGTFEMTSVYFINKCLIAPGVRLFKSLHTLEAVFFERMASYQKDFDLTFCMGNEVLTVNSVTRKLFYKTVKSLFTENVYEGGPEPLQWPTLLKEKKKHNLSWADIHAKFGADDEEEDDEDSDWSEESQEDDDDAEFDEAVEDISEESDAFEEESDDDSFGEVDYDDETDEEDYQQDSKRTRYE